MKTSLTIAAGAALALCGCATFVNPARLAPGSTPAEVRQIYGAPTGEYTLAGGTRYEYATGPFGKFTWMVDFGADGRLREVQQVLTEARFNAVQAGLEASALRSTLGRPSEVWRIGRMKQDVWRYRYDSPFCQLFQVSVGDDGKVVDTGYAPDPVCDSTDNDRSFN